MLGGNEISRRNTDENVRSDKSFLHRTAALLSSKFLLPFVHTFLSTLIDHSHSVTHDDIFFFNSVLMQELDASDTCSPCTIQYNFGSGCFSIRDDARVDESGKSYDRSPVLVVVHNRDRHQLLKSFLNHEAVRRFNVLKIYSSERGC
jgi:hypothetical protein